MPSSSISARPTVILATLAAVAIALAVFATAATVIVASDATRQHSALSASAGRVPLPSPTVARGQLYEVQTLPALVDSMVRRLGALPVADSVDIALMSRLWLADDGADLRAPTRAVWLRVPDSLLPLNAPSVDAARIARVLAYARANGTTLNDSLESDFTRAAPDTLTEWLGRWRRFARSQPLPPLWGYRPGLPGVRSAFDMPTRDVEGLVALAELNELSGWLASRAGHDDQAIARGLENLSASRHHLESPLLLDLLAGLRMAASGAHVVATAAARLGDSTLVAQAHEVLRRTDAKALSFLALRAEALRDAADPATPVTMELFEDEKLPFAVRVEILYATIAGSCRSTREVLFGVAPQRQATLELLATRWRDDPALGPVLALMPPAAELVRESPASRISAEYWPTTGMLDVLLPEATAARAVACQHPF